MPSTATAAAATAAAAVAASNAVSDGDARTVGWGGEVTGGSATWACRRAVWAVKLEIPEMHEVAPAYVAIVKPVMEAGHHGRPRPFAVHATLFACCHNVSSQTFTLGAGPHDAHLGHRWFAGTVSRVGRLTVHRTVAAAAAAAAATTWSWACAFVGLRAVVLREIAAADM